MNEPTEARTVPVAEITPLRRISGLWLIPLITLIVAGLVLYDNYKSQGPLISISFANASGLEAGVTAIKVRDVEIGQIEDITLNDTLDRVIVSARIHNEFRQLLVDDSRFWVVQPTISLAGISGLNTLISGQYIRFSKGSGTRLASTFFGLDQPPVTPQGAPGLHLTLVTDGDFSFSKGDTINYQGLNVGKIEDMRFDLAASKIYYDAFIEAPFHELITDDTRFWKTSGLRAELTNEGFQVEVSTLDSVLLGGISFTTPAGLMDGEQPSVQTEFYVYPNRNAINITQYQYAVPYWIMVSDNLSGLNVGSPVVHRGIQVGRVVRTDYIPEGGNLLDRDFAIPLLIEINPGRLGLPDTQESLTLAQQDINTWIEQGLSASITTQNILLGQKAVELIYNTTRANSELAMFADIPIIPTDLDSIDKFAFSIETLISKINQLPLESMIGDVSKTAQDASATLAGIDELIKSSHSLIGDERNAGMVEQLTATLAEIEALATSFSAESATTQEVQNTMRAVSELMNEFRPLIIELRNNPNSLVFPVITPAEQTPKRKQP